MSRAERRVRLALAQAQLNTQKLGGDEPRQGKKVNMGAYAKAIVAMAVAVVAGLVTATMDSSAGGSHVVANEVWVIVGAGLAALAATYAVPNKPTAL